MERSESVFIWYRIRPGCEPRARAWLATTRQAVGDRGPRWYCRLEGGRETWMEAYAEGALTTLDAVERCVEQHGLLDCIDGKRHAERFIELGV